MKYKVSIIVPVYNVDKYVEECIISLVHQTYRNIEIILVDDGSLDKSGKICDKWSQKDRRIKVIHKKNGGLSDARNVGIKKATGNYLAFVDGDDWVSINFIEKMLNSLIKYDADMAICKFARIFSDGSVNINSHNPHKIELLNRKEFFVKLTEDTEITNHIWRKIYKKELFNNTAFPIGKNFEDIYLMPELVKKCQKIINLPDIEYYYRQNDEGIVKNINLKNVTDHFEANIKEDNSIIKQEPELKKYVQTWHVIKDFGLLEDLKFVKTNLKDIEFLKDKIIADVKRQKWNSNYLPISTFKKILFTAKKYIPSFRNETIQRLGSKEIKKKLGKVKLKTILFKREYKTVKKFKQLKKDKKPIFLIISTPQHGNLGDEALKFGEIKFVKTYFSNYSLFLLPLDDLYMLPNIVKLVDDNDIVALHAGGNIGTLYPGIQKVQMKALSLLKNKKVFIFPQTFYFSDTQFGHYEIQKTDRILKSISKLIVFVRDAFSKEFILNNFKGITVKLMPDMALFLNPKISSLQKRHGALTLLRKDSEKTLSPKDKDKILNELEKKYSDIYESDMHLYYDGLSEKESKEAVIAQLKRVSSAELVVTDRLHGMLFCALTNTPCIVVKSKSPKIQGVYQWIKNNKYIELIENIDELSQAINRVTKQNNPILDRKKIEKKFVEMSQIIKES
ncbi:glycosyltransferase [Lactobacillus amylovorus]|uniref:glycosyltransferase n=1 Tax=Lactobacillus amylovorus TaxID=1604 RepID=UPI001F56781E|nr:glycosyltransferase [Lactobacillus amylovorus]UNL46187.1 glycosyltransferase [Lactobacillus amylovorus]